MRHAQHASAPHASAFREAAELCDRGFALRTRLVKLRWMGLDGEADRVAEALGALECARPATLPLPMPRID